MLSMQRGPDVTVTAAATDSPAMISAETIGDCDYLSVKSPAGLVAAATIQVSLDFDADYRQKVPQLTLAQATAAASWVAAPAGSNLGAAGVLANFLAGLVTSVAWRIHLAAGDAADRTFQVCKRTYTRAGYGG